MSNNIDTLVSQYRELSTTGKTEMVMQINIINAGITNAKNNKSPLSQSNYEFIQKIKNHWADNNQNIIY